MEEKLSFKDLIEEYEQRTEIFNEVIQEIDVEELQKEIDNNSIDIERYKNEDSNLLVRIEELKAELNKIENIGLQYDIGNAKEECENKILEVEELREKNNSKIEKLKKENEANEYNITRFNNKDEEKKKLDDEIIKQAEERAEKFNNKLLKQIEKLNERKDKYGIGKDIKQYTKEEKVVIDKIQEEIDGINKQIEKNKIMLKYFKENLGKNKKRTAERKEEKISHKPEELEQTETEQTKPEQTEPVQPKPEQTEPVQPKPEKTQIPQTPEGKYKDISSTSKYKLTRMKVCPITNTVTWELVDKNGIAGYEEKKLDYTKEYFESDEIKGIIEKCQKDLGEEYDNIESLSKELDPNILSILNSFESKDMLNKYVKSVYDLEALPFELEYDLKDMYKSDMLYNKEKSNINRVAKRVEFLDGAEVVKDGLFKRAFGKIKSMIDKHTRRKLVEDNKTYGETYEEYEGKASYKKEEPEIKNSILNRAKNKVIALENNAKHFTSQKLSKENIKSGVKNLGKETIGGLKIAGTRISGYFKGENPIVTNNKVRAIREKSFVQKVSIDHQKAQQNATEKAAESQQSKQATR